MGNRLWTYVAWAGVFSAGVHLMGEWRRWRELPATTLTLPTGRQMSVELANTPEARSKGLSQRANLVRDGLFLRWPEAGHHPIWMADMRFPLDIVWLDDAGRVLAIAPDAEPCAEQPCQLLDPPDARHAAQSVLELHAGDAERHGLGVGTRILISAIEGAR